MKQAGDQLRFEPKPQIEETSSGKPVIIITEIPYQVNKARLIEKIADLVRDKKIDGITDLRDESDRNGMRIVIELRRDANANVLLNNLYKQTALQTSFGINLLALVDGQPKVLSLEAVSGALSRPSKSRDQKAYCIRASQSGSAGPYS